MKRCPKHPDHDALGTSCEIWVSDTKMCGHAFESVPQEEIRAKQVADLKESLEKTTLADWIVTGIRQWAYDIGHSCGQAEVDGYVQEWLYRFEELQRNAVQETKTDEALNRIGDTAMRWTNVSDAPWGGIPPVSDEPTREILGYSDEVLCQRSDGRTFTGYVRHDMDGDFDPCWTQSGRDMYDLDDIVRWIPLSEVVGHIATLDDHGYIACPWCGKEAGDLLDHFPGSAWHNGSSVEIKCAHCGKPVTLIMTDTMKMSEPVRFTLRRPSSKT